MALIPHGSIKNGYVTAGHMLENYGANIRANIQKGQSDLKSGKSQTYGSINPFPNPLKGSSYQKPK